ncbi:MAG: hypothetical protein ACLTYN_08015 [Dysosmobacter welbionis]
MKSMAARLEPMGEFGRNILTRPPEPVKRGKIYEYDQTPADLVWPWPRSRAGRANPAAAPLRFPEHRPARALSRGEQGPGDLSRLGLTASPGFCCFGQLQPQRGGGHLLAVLSMWARILHLAGVRRTALSGRSGSCPGSETVRDRSKMEMKEIEIGSGGYPVCLWGAADRPGSAWPWRWTAPRWTGAPEADGLLCLRAPGIRLLRMEDTRQLCSTPDYADVIRKAFEIRCKPASSASRRWRC